MFYISLVIFTVKLLKKKIVIRFKFSIVVLKLFTFQRVLKKNTHSRPYEIHLIEKIFVIRFFFLNIFVGVSQLVLRNLK